MSNNDKTKVHQKPCSNFKPQKWRQNVCSECFHLKEDHTKSLFEAQLGSEGLHSEDPTEVFELLDIIGTGAYGSVFMGREIATQQIYAIKFLELEKSKGNEIQSIVNEINIMKQSMECPYIVEYHGCYMKDEIIMMVMEYCSCSVEDMLSYCPETRFEEQQIAAVCASIVKGLAFLHSYGITHRDIKSGNVLLKETGEVKLADFGVSHKLQHERDKMKTLAGSPYWCAPELITADSYDNKVDIWAMGIVALEMAETRPPHWDMEPLQVIFHIPKEPAPTLKEPQKWSKDFIAFLDLCLKKNPQERASAKELLCHPFVLQGSSSQILIPLVKQTIPILLPRKQEDLKEDQDEEGDTFAQKGTILAVDRSTYRADVVDAKAVEEKRAKERQKKKFFGISVEQSMIECEKNKRKHLTDIIISYLLDKALDIEGLFKISGDTNKINELKVKFENDEEVDIRPYSYHDLTGLLKLYLRELPEPLLISTLYISWIESQKISKTKQRIESIKNLLKSVPSYNKKLLEKIIVFLAVVASHSSKNKMNSENLSKAIGPCLLYDKNETTQSIALVNGLINTMIEHNKQLF